jgi:hypothetical protein
MISLLACFTTLFIFLLWFLGKGFFKVKESLVLKSPKQPKTELYSKVRSQIKTGDLLMTRGKNLISDLHCKWLQTPISHVGIAVVENEGDELTRVFIFESSPGRGAQLRDFEDYARNGVSDVYIRHLQKEHFNISRNKIMKIIESFYHADYSFKFLADIPFKLLGFEKNDEIDKDFQLDFEFDEQSFNCSDLVYEVYKKLSLVNVTKNKKLKKRWFPKDFFLNKVQLLPSAFSDIRSVYFDDLDQVDKKRIQVAFKKVFELFVKTY